MAEDYVRPPIVASEPASRFWSVWRFRLVVIAVLVVVALAIVLIVRAVVGGGEGSPDVGNGQAAPSLTSTATTVPPVSPGPSLS